MKGSSSKHHFAGASFPFLVTTVVSCPQAVSAHRKGRRSRIKNPSTPFFVTKFERWRTNILHQARNSGKSSFRFPAEGTSSTMSKNFNEYSICSFLVWHPKNESSRCTLLGGTAIQTSERSSKIEPSMDSSLAMLGFQLGESDCSHLLYMFWYVPIPFMVTFIVTFSKQPRYSRYICLRLAWSTMVMIRNSECSSRKWGYRGHTDSK